MPPREGNDRPTHLLLYYLSFPLTLRKKADQTYFKQRREGGKTKNKKKSDD